MFKRKLFTQTLELSKDMVHQQNTFFLLMTSKYFMVFGTTI
jgi:hypothetical protein